MQNIDRFYGRTKTRTLSEKQKKVLKTLLPKFQINGWTNNCSKSVYLEIGFGNGEHITQLALMNPDCTYIGCDFFVNGAVSLLNKINDNNLKNIKIFNDDIRKLFPNISDNSIDGVFLLFPDPWPKNKHKNRRFINETNIQNIHKILKKNGFLRIATDHIKYALHILEVLQKTNHLFNKTKEYSNQNRPPEVEWPKTKYERKTSSDSIMFVEYRTVYK
jgi:tRNA (guanine-N7-)-methyltransferase